MSARGICLILLVVGIAGCGRAAGDDLGSTEVIDTARVPAPALPVEVRHHGGYATPNEAGAVPVCPPRTTCPNAY